ncbi:hypothetical protein O984_24325 [Mycobacterium avium 05-4293]|nr:hypothetical protein O984_24325 [Mycobacterium avium 05-4293]
MRAPGVRLGRTPSLGLGTGRGFAGFVEGGGPIGEVIGAVPGQDGPEQPDRPGGTIGNASTDTQPVTHQLI